MISAFMTKPDNEFSDELDQTAWFTNNHIWAVLASKYNLILRNNIRGAEDISHTFKNVTSEV